MLVLISLGYPALPVSQEAKISPEAAAESDKTLVPLAKELQTLPVKRAQHARRETVADHAL